MNRSSAKNDWQLTVYIPQELRSQDPIAQLKHLARERRRSVNFEDSAMIFLEGRDTLLTLLRDGTLATSMVRALVYELLEVESRLKLLLASGGALERVARALLMLLDPRNGKDRRDVMLTMVGTSPQTISSCLSKLQNKGLITHHRGRIRILEPEGLTAFVQ